MTTLIDERKYLRHGPRGSNRSLPLRRRTTPSGVIENDVPRQDQTCVPRQHTYRSPLSHGKRLRRSAIVPIFDQMLQAAQVTLFTVTYKSAGDIDFESGLFPAQKRERRSGPVGIIRYASKSARNIACLKITQQHICCITQRSGSGSRTNARCCQTSISLI